MRENAQLAESAAVPAFAAQSPDEVVEVRLPNGWSQLRSRREEEISPSTIDTLSGVVATWRLAFPKEGTWVERKLNTPSLLVRLKFLLADDGETPQVVSIDGAPYVGLNATHDPAYRKTLEQFVSGGWPSFVAVIAEDAKSDDDLWLPAVSVKRARELVGKLYLPRLTSKLYRGREDSELIERSVVPVRYASDRSYGRTLGMLEPLEWTGMLDERMESGPCVIKSIRGRGGHAVAFYGLSPEKRPQGKKKGDFVGEKRLQSILANNGGSFKQPLYGPMRLSHCPDYCSIFCLDFGFDRSLDLYRPIGGTWMARRSMVVVPSKDTLIGPLRIPSSN